MQLNLMDVVELSGGQSIILDKKLPSKNVANAFFFC